jgi:hypothetical protein
MKRPSLPPMRPTQSRVELLRSHYNHMAIELRGLEFDLRWGMEGSDRIPAAWSEIAIEPFCPTKEKLSLRIDEDVLRFFRATGQGYLTRMNKVLRTYMLARLAGVVKGAEREKPAPTMMEDYLAEAAIYKDLFMRLEAGAGDPAVLRLEMNRMEPRLTWMEGVLKEMLERLDLGD